MSRDRHHGAGAHALPVLQRLRFLDAAQQMASRDDRRGRHVRGTGAGLDMHFFMVVFHAGLAEQPVPQRDVHLLGHHRALQRQSAVALRWLLHPLRPDGDPQSAPESHDHPQPQDGRVVSGPGMPEDLSCRRPTRSFSLIRLRPRFIAG